MQRRVLVERETELAGARAACAAAAAGHGGVLAIRGPAGIGKTALLGAVAEAGREAGLRPLTAAATDLEQELAFGVVRQLFERHVRALTSTARDAVLAGAAGLAAAIVLERPSDRRPETLEVALHGLYWLAAELAAREPLVLVVDDVQWADAASLRWLAYLKRRLEGVRITVVLACRDGEAGVDQRLLEQVVSESGATVLRPAPLSRAAVERCLSDALDDLPESHLVDECLQRTGGNPFYLHALVGELRAGGGLEHVAPATIARSVAARLARLGPEATRVAETVAVLSRDARLDRVARLTGVSLPVVGELADRLAALEIFGRGQPLTFAHPVLREAVYEQLPPVRRGLLHAAAARMLLDEGARPQEVATHLLPAPPAGEAWVVEALRTAAADALAQGTPDTAVPLLRRALAEPPDARATVLLELAQAEALAQDPAAIEHARTVMDEAPALRPQAALLAADALFRRGDEHEAQAVLAAVDTSGLEPALALEVRAQALLLRSFRDARDIDEELTELGADTLEGRDAGERLLLTLRGVDLSMRALAREPALAVARRAVAGGGAAPTEPEWVLATAARVIEVADHVDESRAVLSRLIADGRRRGAASAVAFACGHRAEVEYRAGRLAQAEADGREALALMREHPHWVRPGFVGILLEVLVDRAPVEAGAAVLAAHADIRASALSPVMVEHWLYGRGLLRAAGGDLAGAAEDLRAAGDAALAWGEINPGLVAWRSKLGLALHALGRAAEARALIDEELELAIRFGAPRAIGIALRARALVQRGEAEVGGLEQALAVLETSVARLEHARVLIDLGAALRRTGRRADAREVLLQGLDGADRCGAFVLGARARDELRVIGARPRRARLSGPDALTASERRVAELARQGLTNRQIAQALFVTTKTVEMHLARVYAKLGVKGRLELPDAMSEGPVAVREPPAVAT